jgi:hypothetical protein
MQPDPAAADAATPAAKSAGAKAKSAALRAGKVQRQLDTIAGVIPAKRVEVSLGEIAPVLADAITHQRGWLSDFSGDTVSIDADLYEVLLAYQKMRQLNAA